MFFFFLFSLHKPTFGYNSPYWTKTLSFNLAGGITAFDGKEAQLPTYWSTSFEQLCVGMKVGNDLKFVSINRTASSLHNLIADNKYKQIKIGREKWKSLITDSSLQRNCNKEGFNVFGFTATKVRLGMLGNNENNCLSPDSFIGFGGNEKQGITCGNRARFYADNGSKVVKTMGYLLVR